MKSQRSNIEWNKLIEEGKRIDFDEIIIQNEKMNNNLKIQVQSYCLKCKKSYIKLKSEGFKN